MALMAENATATAELRKTIAQDSLASKENHRISLENHANTMKEIAERSKENEKLWKETARKIGDLGDKFGYFTEGMALPTMEKILTSMFKIDTIMPRFTKKLPNGRSLEYDVFGYCNGDVNNAVIVEIKSKLRKDDITEMIAELTAFKTIFPEYRQKHLYGILVAVDVPSLDLINQVEKNGLYFARIADNIFKINENKKVTDFNFIEA